jgi:hypothetical protein
MRIAVSGTHFIGKSTLISDFIKAHPEYTTEVEPYYKLQEEGVMELALEPSLESLTEQLNYSIQQINQNSKQNIIFDRCPVDFIAYAMCAVEQDNIDIDDTEVSERFPEIKEALSNLDLIIFLPISKENSIIYSEDNPEYRKLADKCFKKLYRDEYCDIFPGFNHPRIIEVAGDRNTRLKIVESYLK